jgi:hypothetical protein
MTGKRDDWAAYEYACDMVNDLRGRLKAGAEGSGAALSADECDLLLRNLKTPVAPNSRPRGDGLDEIAISIYCTKLQRAGASSKIAVAETARKFGCSRWSVNQARRALRK